MGVEATVHRTEVGTAFYHPTARCRRGPSRAHPPPLPPSREHVHHTDHIDCKETQDIISYITGTS